MKEKAKVKYGSMGGIYSCLREAAADGLEGLFFAPCDAPFYTVDAIDKLINLIGKENHAAFWKSADGRIQTTFGWYSVRCLDCACWKQQPDHLMRGGAPTH